MTPPPAAATLPGRVVRPGRSRQRARTLPPRRISGPAKRVPPVPHLPDRLLDRLIGGRTWIAVIAFALIGIVGMQLWVVKLGVGIGRAVEHTQLLQQENSVLSAEDSALSSGERIERLALAKGMVPASPVALHFDTVRGPLDARLAAAALAKPIQAPTTSSPAAGGPTSAETSTGSAGAEPSSSAASGATVNPTSTSPPGGEATGTEATPAQASTTPETTTAQAPTPVAEAAPRATGGSTEAASASLGSGGGTQAPGG
jgi:cell division protein FtsL